MSDEIPLPDQYLQCIIPFKQALDAADEDPGDLNQVMEHVGMAHAEVQRLFGDIAWEDHDEYFAELRRRLEAAEPEDYPDILHEAVERFLDETADADDLTEGLI